MIRDDIATERRQMIRDWSAAQARSKQTALGWSEVGHECDRYVWSILHGTPKGLNPEQKVLASFRGTAFHALAEGVFLSAGFKVEMSVEWQGIPGHVDLYKDGVVEDIKTGDSDKVRALRSYGPEQNWRWQVHGYGQSLINAGVEVRTVRITAYAVDTSDDICVWEEPFDPAVAAEAVARAAALAEQEQAPNPGKDPDWCRDWCQFFDETASKGGCPSWGTPDSFEEITDPAKRSAALDLRAARDEDNDFKGRKDAASSLLDGVRGTVDGFVVRPSGRKGTTKPDVDALDLDAYEAIIGPVPMKTTGAASWVSVTKAPRAKRGTK